MSAVGSADIYKLAQAMRESSGGAQVTTQEVLINSANYIKAEMEAKVPVDTGRLRQSITVRIMSDRVIIGPDTEYAVYVEFGTSPHVIKPKFKKAIAFQSGGRTIIVKQVNHPGTKPQPYVRPAFEEWADTLGELAAEANIKRMKEAYQ